MKNLALILLTLATFSSPLQAIEQSDFYANSKESHELTILNKGLASLQYRLDMIEKAEKSIELEYFIYHDDTSGRLLTQALVEKARQGVRVRVLMDHFLIIGEIDPFHAHELIKNGVEVKFYNDAPLIQFISFQFRNHRKSFIIDGKEAITGGRNIGDEYFDLSEEFNFIDRDVVVKGPIVKTIQSSFDKLWNAEATKFLNRPDKPARNDLRYRRANRTNRVRNTWNFQGDLKRWKDKVKAAKDFIKVTEEDLDFKRRIKTLTLNDIEEDVTTTCNDITFVSDVPGVGMWAIDKKYKHVREEVFRRIKEAKEHVVFDSPYFILNDEITGILDDLLERNVKVDLLTNSLHSTDAIYVSSVFNDRVGKWIAKGLRPTVYSGNIMPGHKVLSDGIHKSRWGTHSKSFVFDNETAMIGTFNMDPRSYKFSVEMGLFCNNNKEVADLLSQNIKDRMENGILLETPEDVKKYEFMQVGTLKRIGYYLLKVPSSLFDFML
ncbi:MAG: phospholipase D family protein [Deltaproteobacteria bacterium]|nr:MAG: phospholipase D family protein [Deltaproteobacteria bacterium]